jgi:hypothetical protein
MHTAIDGNAPGLCGLVEHGSDLENCIKRIVSRDDAAWLGAVGQPTIGGNGQQVLHHAVKPTTGANVLHDHRSRVL